MQVWEPPSLIFRIRLGFYYIRNIATQRKYWCRQWLYWNFAQFLPTTKIIVFTVFFSKPLSWCFYCRFGRTYIIPTGHIEWPDPYSNRWLHLLFLVAWTTEMRHSQACPNTFFDGSSLLRTQQLDSSLLVVYVWPHHSTSSSTPLVDSKGEDWLQAGYSCIYKCMHGTATPYLADEFSRPADSQARYRLRSASSSTLVVRRTRLSTVGDRSFPVAASRARSGLPQDAAAAPSLTVFRNRLKTHLLYVSLP